VVWSKPHWSVARGGDDQPLGGRRSAVRRSMEALYDDVRRRKRAKYCAGAERRASLQERRAAAREQRITAMLAVVTHDRLRDAVDRSWRVAPFTWTHTAVPSQKLLVEAWERDSAYTLRPASQVDWAALVGAVEEERREYRTRWWLAHEDRRSRAALRWARTMELMATDPEAAGQHFCLPSGLILPCHASAVATLIRLAHSPEGSAARMPQCQPCRAALDWAARQLHLTLHTVGGRVVASKHAE